MFQTFPRAIAQLYQAPVNVDKAKIPLFLEKHVIFKFFKVSTKSVLGMQHVIIKICLKS